MFSEELSGNKNLKRQDQARQRRRQAKQRLLQEKKKQHPTPQHLSTATSTTTTTTTATEHNHNATSSQSPSAFATTSDSKRNAALKTLDVSLETNGSSVVEKALEQRKLRAVQKHQKDSSIVIQSFYRSYRSNNQLVMTQKDILDKRLNDLVALGNILSSQKQQKTGTDLDSSSSTLDYTPPPSLANVMINQLLFITHTTPRFHKTTSETSAKDDQTAVHRVYHSKITTGLKPSDASLLSRMIQLVLLPGILSSDIHMDPTIMWMESKEGLVKLKKFLRLCCFMMVAKQQNLSHETVQKGGGGGKTGPCSSGWSPFLIEDETNIRSIIYFLRRILGHDLENTNVLSATDTLNVRQNLHLKCKSLLLSSDISYHRSLLVHPDNASNSSSSSNSGSSRSRIKIIGQMPVTTEYFDLIHLLRSFLFCPSGEIIDGSIIPRNSEELREKCINSKDCARGDSIFNFVLDVAVLNNSVREGKSDSTLQRLTEAYRCRFFTEILTCPLLTWKIESNTILDFVNNPSKSGMETSPIGNSVNRKPAILQCLSAFLNYFKQEISRGLVGSSLVLPTDDVPLSLCPAPAVLCLLANMVVMGKLCPILNGSDITKVEFDACAMYFNAIATIIDVVPLGTLTSRESSVEWMSHGSHLVPIVISKVIREQCNQLLLDSYVRRLFNCAIDDEVLNSEHVLKRKDQKDINLEEELLETGSASATELAAKEAIDRSKKFWQSGWAKKLSKRMTSVFSSDKKPKEYSSAFKYDPGFDAATKNVVDSSENGKKEPKRGQTYCDKYNISFLFALMRTYSIILSRWGGGGKKDMIDTASNSKETTGSNATSKADPCVLSLLNVLCFSTPLLKTLWAIIQSEPTVVSDLHKILDVNKRHDPIKSLNIHDNIGAITLLMFTMILAHTLILTDDIELHDMETPLPRHQIRRLILVLKQLLYRACCLDDKKINRNDESSSPNHLGLSLISSSSKTMRDLYKRSSRRPLCAPKLWLVKDLIEVNIRRCDSYKDYVSLLELPVMRICPFLVSFKCRLKLFERIITSNRTSIQGENDGLHARPGVSVNIMRGRVLEDGLIHLNKLGNNLRQRIIVNYQNEAGTKETGIDAGGLFKDFWTDLSAQSFDPNYALFRVTEGSIKCLYPNPSSRSAHGSVSVVMFEFLGRILGKALYEGITIQPQFAHFFLSFLRGDYNFFHMLPDLNTLDPTLYNNLMFLKTYDGDARDLSLNFTVATDDFGKSNEIPLKPNGVNIDVTNLNKHEYIGLVAKHYVYDRVTEQSEAFTRGLWDVIDRNWLRIFSEPELQVLISGPSDGKIDITDLKSNTRYTGGYTSFDRHMTRFWKVVSSFNSKQQADLLRFVTSCERPPPLGFSSMNPPFTIQRVGILRDGDKLPSASTCFNILKLPNYSSEKVLRERLLYAIQSGSGFELS